MRGGRGIASHGQINSRSFAKAEIRLVNSGGSRGRREAILRTRAINAQTLTTL
jgi:hypothetical protein